MLVLSRREQQRIRLGDSIVLTVVRIAGDRVRIGIEAPDDLLILRDELEPFEGRGESEMDAVPAPAVPAPAVPIPAEPIPVEKALTDAGVGAELCLARPL